MQAERRETTGRYEVHTFLSLQQAERLSDNGRTADSIDLDGRSEGKVQSRRGGCKNGLMRGYNVPNIST